jgi:SHOCT-like domain
MVTSEERMRILKMIQEGKITAEEGAKLLAALRESRKEPRPPSVPGRMNKGWLRVRVTDMATNRAKVNVNLPLGLMDAGLKIGAQYAPELAGIDLTQFIEDIKGGAQGKIIDVIDEEDGEHVEIFVE